MKTALAVRREAFPRHLAREITRFGAGPERFDVMAFGAAGGAKYLATTLADRAAGPGRKVLYCAVEEGQNEALVQRLQRLEIVNADMLISTAATWGEGLADLDQNEGVRMVVVDSFSALYPVPDLAVVGGDLDERGIASILVVHCNKEGHHAGPARLAHEVDVVIEVEALKFEVRKNRFGATVRGNVDLSGGSAAHDLSRAYVGRFCLVLYCL